MCLCSQVGHHGICQGCPESRLLLSGRRLMLYPRGCGLGLSSVLGGCAASTIGVAKGLLRPRSGGACTRGAETAQGRIPGLSNGRSRLAPEARTGAHEKHRSRPPGFCGRASGSGPEYQPFALIKGVGVMVGLPLRHAYYSPGFAPGEFLARAVLSAWFVVGVQDRERDRSAGSLRLLRVLSRCLQR